LTNSAVFGSGFSFQEYRFGLLAENDRLAGASVGMARLSNLGLGGNEFGAAGFGILGLRKSKMLFVSSACAGSADEGAVSIQDRYRPFNFNATLTTF